MYDIVFAQLKCWLITISHMEK